ncbi:MAG: SRPBCC family protein [Acidobacteriota bacterium]|nr:SRPBCC family protein [Acidobacteriota bacterium]MDH3528247.1 SRPBCC family protein [Acidobacteriota bacterium]
MKYVVDTVIDRPVNEVISKFDDPENLKEWMDGLLSFEPISGTPGEIGAKAKLVFQMGKKKIEMIETITAKNLPDEFGGTYEAEGVFNTVMNRFESVGNDQTRMTQQCEFEFTSFMMKVMGFFIPGAFKSQTRKHMDAFKSFAERDVTGRVTPEQVTVDE